MEFIPDGSIGEWESETPLVMSPIYNNDGDIVFKSNRMQGHHFGIMGNPCADLQYRILYLLPAN